MFAKTHTPQQYCIACCLGFFSADVSSLLADVFPSKYFAAGFTFEAAQMPLPVQC